MNTMWLDEPPMYGCRQKLDEDQEVPAIVNWRRTEFVDFMKLHELVRMKTFDVFGDVDPAIISENSCLSLVQLNTKNEVVTNISLCNYPNLPSIPSSGWTEWISRHYGMYENTERNTLFVHMLLWDVRYNDEFFKRLLDAVFISNVHITHVVLIMPPMVTPVGFVEEHMTRIVTKNETDSYRVQALYVSFRHSHCPRLKIRRVVEEDNDDIIPILDRESRRFKELYGEFYISEMMRNPDGLRQLIVAEADGLATGVLCLNKIIDVETLNNHFELGPYQGLRKSNLSDKILSENEGYIASDILFPVAELEKKDYFKVRTRSNISTPSDSEEMNDDSFDGEHDKTEPECSCSDDGETCSEAFFDAPCPSCKKSTKNRVLRISMSSDNSSDIGKKSNSRLGSISGTAINLSKSKIAVTEEQKTEPSLISANKSEIRIDRDDQKLNEVTGPGKSSISRISGSTNATEETLYKKVTMFATDSTTNELASSRSEKSSPRSMLQLTEDSGPNVGTGSEDFLDEETLPIDNIAVEINPQTIVHKEIILPMYHGQANAFTLELFSMREDVDERLSYDYLEAVFECFPEEEYCVVLIPPSFPTFPLLQNFVRVPLRFNKDYPLVLYLAHRAAVIGNLRTRDADPSDEAAVNELLADVPKGKKVLQDFKFSFHSSSPYFAYVFFCENALIGFAVLCLERDIEFIRSHYNIDDFIVFDHLAADSHAQIIHLTIMPIFASLHRYFFQELMRLSEKRALYYRLYYKKASALTRAEPLVTFLGEMIPVNPRRKLRYCLENYSENQPADFVLKEMEESFALYMITPRVASAPKIDINVRVVVVGASDCGLAFLESLIFGPNVPFVNFANLTLVSQTGIPFENRPDDVEQDELPFTGRYCRDFRRVIGTRAWINVVHGTLTAINRKDKFITVSSMGNISYDYLVLTCGLQYQRPKFIEELRAEKRGEHGNYPNPENCLTVNSERDAANCLNYCKRVIAEKPSSSLILYGKNIDCYSALAMLLKSGFEASNITLIEPAVQICETQNTNFFNNDEVEEAVMTAIEESGATVLPGWDLVDWNLEGVGEDFFIRDVTVERKRERKKINCDVLFNFKEKTINLYSFLAICRSGLVFDGALVIDPEFQTNDPCIFAAGTVTKYSRRFYADQSSHKYYNLLEVGERLAQKLRNIIDPQNADEDHLPLTTSKLDAVIPVFKKPIIISCRLPGNYFYLTVKRPGNSVTYDTNDVVLITGYPNSSIGYFQLHLNQFDAVETITCLSKKEFEFENYITLYGKHQALLNDLKIRFQNSMVPDLYAYFREPWAVALFLDRFECLRVENRATLLSPTVVRGDSLIHDCMKALIKSKWDAIKPEDRELIETRYAGSVYQEELENSLIEFLQHSQSHLPMYCNPNFLRRLLDEMELTQGDPLFHSPSVSTL